ncbi:hypothetical protein J6590_108557 [Homalodisca vitripennis]|nr:hypothetical protein J6590_108557 [Homalodisca vitripennis]
MVSYIINGFENKEEICTLLLDLSKAFDIVPHSELIEKLNHYGLGDVELSLFSSYLSDRYQFVKLSGQNSDLKRVTRGVPQGSVLGPFLFVVFINDLPKFLPNKSILYADDTTLMCSSKLPELNLVMMDYMKERSYLWFTANSLRVNEDKSEEIIFNLGVNSVNKSVKLLGLHLDSRLTWRAHTDALCARLCRVIFLLKKLKFCTSCNLVLKAYFALFHSHLLYGTLLWGGSSGAKEVFLCQKRAVRTIFNISYSDTCKPYFIEYDILTLPSIFILQILSYVKENLELFNLRSSVHNHYTRNQHSIDQRFARLSKTHGAYLYLGVKLFNKLPLVVRDISCKNFKNSMTKWLKEKAFYSVEEFYSCSISDCIFM